MTWIRTIPLDKATGELRSLYQRIKGPNDTVDNIMMAHSLRPHSMEGHLALYKAVLHHRDNALPRWFLEALGLYVSMLNSCDYCVQHHYEGMRRLLKDDARSQAIRGTLEYGNPQASFGGKELAAMRYAERLTRSPADVTEEQIMTLREAGLEDGEILEINQLVSYFAYANRMVLGLGVTTKGDVLGLSPSSDNPEDWSHR